MVVLVLCAVAEVLDVAVGGVPKSKASHGIYYPGLIFKKDR